jgi:hypothetical protein
MYICKISSSENVLDIEISNDLSINLHSSYIDESHKSMGICNTKAA